MKNESMSKWLEKVNTDQNLQGLENIVNTEKNDEGRRYFVRQDIAPQIAMSRYNPITGHCELGPEDRNAHSIATSTTSVATHDFVITNGQTWEIQSVGGSNQTQVSTAYVYYYDGANLFPMKAAYSGGGAVVGATPGEGAFPIRITGNGTVAVRIVFQTCNVGVDVMRAILWYRRVS